MTFELSCLGVLGIVKWLYISLFIVHLLNFNSPLSLIKKVQKIKRGIISSSNGLEKAWKQGKMRTHEKTTLHLLHAHIP